MISEWKKFTELCQKENYSEKDIELFNKSREFAIKYLEDEKIISGEPQIIHNIKIARILIKNKLFSEVVAAGILYGVESHTTRSEIEKHLGNEIAGIVYAQNLYREIRQKNILAKAENLRKILLVTLSDIRVIFIKLADKLENLNHIELLQKNEKNEFIKEIFEIYAPLAKRLGLEKVKRELEDKAFKELNSRKYSEIENFLDKTKSQRENFIERCTKEVSEIIKDKVSDFEIKGRRKSVYSIYKKIIERKVSLDQQKDIFGIRIIVESKEDCYSVLGILLEKYDLIEGTFKDYIRNPKPNGYQSLHTAIKFQEKILEVQIRTKEMNEVAEEGIAAHWSYKKMKSDLNFEKKIGWLKSVIDLQLSKKDKELLKSTKVDLFDEEIYCYTPKGDLIALPKKSTVLDFAYQIHDKLGEKAVAGRVNKKFSSLKKELVQGDIVEIITDKSQRPRREWLKFVVSRKAISSIRKSVKKYENVGVAPKISFQKKDKNIFDPLVYSDAPQNFIFNFAKCCSPIPGKELLGIEKSYRKVVVHSKDCEKINASGKNFVAVHWKENPNSLIMMNVESMEKSGILAELLNIIVNESFVIKETKAKLLSGNTIRCIFIIFPRNIDSIKKVIERIQKTKGFKKIYFGE